MPSSERDTVPRLQRDDLTHGKSPIVSTRGSMTLKSEGKEPTFHLQCPVYTSHGLSPTVPVEYTSGTAGEKYFSCFSQ